MSRARENLHFAVKRRHSPGDGSVDSNAKPVICKNSSGLRLAVCGSRLSARSPRVPRTRKTTPIGRLHLWLVKNP
jgi:hypothetical protein